MHFYFEITLPIEYLQPIIDVLKCYQKNFGTSILFTTASMPILEKGKLETKSLIGINHIKEIIPDIQNIKKALKRVDIKREEGIKSYDEIAKEISHSKKILCIVNTRKIAKEIFDRLPQDGFKIHLSRMMCPAHIKEKIKEIKESLKDKKCTTLRVVATQLIEAGVDIDFPVVYRQIAGLDSILQAAGRCNREGKLAIGNTYLFELGEGRTIGFLNQTCNSTKALGKITDYYDDKILDNYYTQLYSRATTFDKANIKDLLYKPYDFYFETAANQFKLIDDDGISIIVNYQNSLELIKRLKEKGPNYQLVKQLGQYCVNVRKKDFAKLKETGNVEEIIEGFFYLNNPAQYKEDVGLIIENTWTEELLIK